MTQWNVELYQAKHNYVWQYGANLLEMLAPQPREKILDLGCGTGELTNLIAASGAIAVGLDSAQSAVANCRQNYPQIEFIEANGADFQLRNFDAVFSNAALHWIKPPQKAVNSIFEALKPEGRFVAEFGGKGNIEQIIRAIDAVLSKPSDNPWYFPTIGEYTTLLETRGFKVNYAVLFDRPTKLAEEDGLANWLEMFANDRFMQLNDSAKKEAIAQIKSLLRPTLYRDGQWWADYCRIRVVATKPS